MSKQLPRAALLSYVNILVNILLGLVVTPIIIEQLGNAEYGVYLLIGAFAGYLTVLDLGLNNAIVRYVALYRANGEKQQEENFLAVVMLIYAGIGIFLLLLGILFYHFLPSLYAGQLTPDELLLARKMLTILLINVVITIPVSAFLAICNGYEHFIFPRAIKLVRYIVRSTLVVLILYQGSNALGIVLLDTILNLLLLIALLFFVFSRLKVRIRLHSFSTAFTRSIMSYSVWIFLFVMIYELQWRSGQLILGALFDPGVVAVYGVGVMLGIYFTGFGNVLNNLLLPKAVRSVAKELSPEQLTNQTIAAGRLTLAVCLFIAGGFLLLGDQFVELWVGQSYREAWLVALLIMGVYLLPLSQGYAHALLEANKKVRYKALMAVLCAFAGITIGAFAAANYGIKGMIGGICAGLFLLQIIMTLYYHRILKIRNSRFFKEVYGRLAIPLGLLFFGLWWCRGLLELSWLNFAFQGLAYATLAGGLTFFALLNSRERDRLKVLVPHRSTKSSQV